MKNKKNSKKLLPLTTETLRQLDQHELRVVAGAKWPPSIVEHAPANDAADA
jgi:hypothetical protein